MGPVKTIDETGADMGGVYRQTPTDEILFQQDAAGILILTATPPSRDHGICQHLAACLTETFAGSRIIGSPKPWEKGFGKERRAVAQACRQVCGMVGQQ